MNLNFSRKGWGTLVLLRFEGLNNWFASRGAKTSSPAIQRIEPATRPPGVALLTKLLARV